MPIHRRHFSAALVASVAAARALAEFRVEISGIGGTQLPIAIAKFRDEGRGDAAVSEIVRADLERSGAFRLVDASGTLDERSAPVYADWRARGADALVGGSMTQLVDGRWDVRYKLWDIVKGEEVFGQALAVLPADLRLAAHKIADAIFLRLVGVRGVNATRIAYVIKAANRFSLRIADADGEGGNVALASPQPILSPAWSPDGTRLAYVSFETGKAVVMMQQVSNGARRVIANYRGSNSAPAWSPDGKRLVVTLSRDGGSHLYLIDLAGGEPQRLTQGSAIDTEACFAPDGRSLYFVSDRGGSPQVYRMALDAGASAQRVTFDSAYSVSPAISPDGSLLAYISRGAGFRLMALPLDAGAQSQPLTDTDADEHPSFAPNGRLLVYATRVQGRGVLMTTTIDGKVRTRLQTRGADLREPAWGPFSS